MSARPETIPEIASVTREQFERDVVAGARPLVLRGVVGAWPAARCGRESPEAVCRYLLERDSGAPVDTLLLRPEEKGRIFYNAGMDGFNFVRNRVPLSQVVEQIVRYSRFESAPAVAAQSAPVRACLPRFLEENPMPLLDAAVEPRIWLGNAVTVPAHFDDAHNVACVVAGRRRFTLLPPEQVGNLYIGPIDFAPTGAPISLVDFSAPDFERFPRFREAQASMLVAELAPGDAVYIPPLWWHHVQSLEPCNVLVNYWWGASHGNDAGLDCLTHALLTLRRLPPAQRRAWAALFGHFVFAETDRVVEHIPPARRGLLGDPDAETVRRLRLALAGRLGS
jgi:hypothetical protein